MSASDPQREAQRLAAQYATDRSLNADERAALAEQLRRQVAEIDNALAGSKPTGPHGAPDIGVEPR